MWFLFREYFIIVQLKVSNRMPHYLRMLIYASQPHPDWGPARKEDQYDRYEPKILEIKTNLNIDDSNNEENNKTHINEVFDGQ